MQTSYSFLVLAAFQLAHGFHSGFRTVLHAAGHPQPPFTRVLQWFSPHVFSHRAAARPPGSSAGLLAERAFWPSWASADSREHGGFGWFCGGNRLTEGWSEPGDNEVSGDGSAIPTPHADDIHRF